MTVNRDSAARKLPLFLLAAGLTLPAHATDYYVSAAGNDANAGTTAESAWRTVAKANSITFRPGDRLLLEGGKTFAGPVQLTGADGGAAGTPVVVGSYGTGRAIIDGGAGSGITITNGTGFRVNNLKVIGLGRKTGNYHGTGVAVTGASSVSIDQVEVAGFQHAGVDVSSSSNVRLTNVYAHDNGYAGITARATTNSYVGYCRALNNPGDPTITTNHSGNGIVVSGRQLTIEYCEAAYNGYDMQQVNDNGPVGIWCYDADQVTIQFCISHNNKSPQSDGGGFDLDGGVTNSVVQYNYAYENKSYGYLAWEYGSAVKWTGNVFRYNISVNNAGPGLMLGTTAGQGVNNGEVYNNLFYSTTYPAVTQYGGVTNFHFRNNIFVGPSTGSLVDAGGGLSYQANNYWVLGGGFLVGGYSSLAAWADATGQEKLNGTIVGLNADPQLKNPVYYERLTNPTKLPTLTAFLVPAGAAVAGRGLDLKSLFGIDPGTRDFYGNPISASAGFDVGVQEVSGIGTAAIPAPAPPVTATNVVLNPGFEADQAAVPAPQRWSTWAGSAGTDADADYTETNGGAHAGSYHGTHYKTSAYEVFTFQTAASLPNGLYTLRAWTKSSGGQTYAIVLAKNYGGAQVSANVPVTAAGGTAGAWQLVELRDISVTNGQCEVGFYSKAGAGQWLFFDDVELLAQSTGSTAAKSSSTLLVGAPPMAHSAPAPATFEAWPNPAQDELTVSYPSAKAQLLDIKISSLFTAQLRLQLRQPVAPGSHSFTLGTAALAPGLYLLQIKEGDNGRVQTRRISIGRP